MNNVSKKIIVASVCVGLIFFTVFYIGMTYGDKWWGALPFVLFLVCGGVAVFVLMLYAALDRTPIDPAETTTSGRLGFIAVGLLALLAAYAIGESFINEQIKPLPGGYLEVSWQIGVRAMALAQSFVVYYYLKSELEGFLRGSRLLSNVVVIHLITLAASVGISWVANYVLFYMLADAYKPVSVSPALITVTSISFYVIGIALEIWQSRKPKPGI